MLEIKSSADLEELSPRQVHYVRILGLLDEISFNGEKYYVKITQNNPGESPYSVKIFHKEELQNFDSMLIKWILFTLKENVNVEDPFKIRDISQSNKIFLDCECKYVISENGNHGLFLVDLTPLEFDYNNEFHRDILNRAKGIYPKLEPSLERIPLITRTTPDKIRLSQNSSSSHGTHVTFNDIDTSRIQSQKSQTGGPLYPKKRGASESQQEFCSQSSKKKKNDRLISLDNENDDDDKSVRTQPTVQIERNSNNEEEEEEEDHFQDVSENPPSSPDLDSQPPDLDSQPPDEIPNNQKQTQPQELEQQEQEQEQEQILAHVQVVEQKQEQTQNTAEVVSDSRPCELRFLSDLDQLKEANIEFAYRGYVISYIQVKPDLYRYMTILKIGQNNVQSVDGFVEIYGNSKLTLGEYDFLCITLQGQHNANLMNYHILQFLEVKKGRNDMSDDDDNGDKRYSDPLYLYKDVSLHNKREMFIRMVGLCVSISHENSKFVSLCLTDFTSHKKLRTQYVYERFIDDHRSFRFGQKDGFRVTLYPEHFNDFNNDIKERYNGLTLDSSVYPDTFNNISRFEIVVELTLKVNMYKDYLSLVVRGHKLLTRCKSNSSFSHNIRSSLLDIENEPSVIKCHVANILALSKEIKKGTITTRERALTDQSRDIDRAYDGSELYNKTLQIESVKDLLLTYGGCDIGGGKIIPSVEMICETDNGAKNDDNDNNYDGYEGYDVTYRNGSDLQSPSENSKLLRIIVPVIDLFFLGADRLGPLKVSSTRENDPETSDGNSSLNQNRRLLLNDIVTKIRNGNYANDTFGVEIQAFPEGATVAHPINNRIAPEITLQGLL